MTLDEITYETTQTPGATSVGEAEAGAARSGVAIVTLNRPERLNAISSRPGGMRDQILFALAEAEADDAIGCLVLRGAGRAFCGGGDLTGNARRERAIEDVRFVEDAARFHDRLRASRLPTIAAVHGHCLGAGLLLAAACDLVIAAEDALFGFPEGRVGLIGAAAMVPVLGRQWAKFLMLTGESITAAHARQLGIVLAVEPDGDLQERVVDLAHRITRMPRQATELNRRAIDAAADASGEMNARLLARAHDAITLTMAAHAAAPDGRTFRSIIETEGMEGLKKARAAQYSQPWLRAYNPDSEATEA